MKVFSLPTSPSFLTGWKRKRLILLVPNTLRLAPACLVLHSTISKANTRTHSLSRNTHPLTIIVVVNALHCTVSLLSALAGTLPKYFHVSFTLAIQHVFLFIKYLAHIPTHTTLTHSHLLLICMYVHKNF